MTWREAFAAGSVAAVVSGAPSTVRALLTRTDQLAPTLAAGSLLLPDETRPARLVAAAGVVHGALSLGWAVVLDAGLPRRDPVVAGTVAGLGIAALDLGLVGRRLPRIRALPPWPQIADHVAYAVTVAVVLARRHRLAQVGPR